jgi:hypothetical protein
VSPVTRIINRINLGRVTTPPRRRTFRCNSPAGRDFPLQIPLLAVRGIDPQPAEKQDDAADRTTLFSAAAGNFTDNSGIRIV